MAWYNSSWLKRKKITIDQTQVDSDLTNFPTFVNLNNSDIISDSRKDRNDIVFTSSDGTTKLDHELVKDAYMGVGGWCWFSEPRAIRYSGTYDRTYVGSIDGSGNLYVGQYTTGSLSAPTWTTLTAALQADDHNNPALIVRPDGKLVAFYTRHSLDAYFRFKISTNAEDSTAWGSEQVGPTSAIGDITYANPVIIPADSDACYVFSRANSAGFKFGYSRSTDYSTWSAFTTVWHNSGGYSYTNIIDDGAGRIDFLSSDGHPSANTFGTSMYHYYALWDTGTSTLKFYNSAGTEQTLPMGTSNATLIYDGSASNTVSSWGHQIIQDSSGYPRVLFQKRVSTTGTGDWRCMFARWNGSAWTTPVEITPLGGYIYSGEVAYTGLSNFDGQDPSIVYVGKQVSGQYEIQKWITTDTGSTWAKDIDITTGTPSGSLNARPVSPKNHNGEQACLYWGGTYTSYVSFSSDILAYPPAVKGAYVEVPSVSGSADTDIYVYYKNSTATAQENAAATWGNGYNTVIHLADPTDDQKLTAIKKPTNSVNAARFSEALQTYSNTADLGTSINMAGWASATVEVIMKYDGTGAAGINNDLYSSWLNTTTASSLIRVMSTSSSNALKVYYVKEANGQVGGDTGATVAINTVKHIASVYDSTSVRGYVSGVVGGTTYTTGGAAIDATATTTTYTGIGPAGANPLKGGKIYEVRVSNVARSAAWLKATSISTLTPGTFYTLSAAEDPPTDTTVSVPLATLTTTAYAPTVTATNHQIVSVPLATLTATAYAPTVTATSNQTVNVPLATATLTAYAPTVTAYSGITVSVPLATLSITAYEPTVSISQNITVDIPLAQLILTTFAPDVIVPNPVTVSIPLATVTLTAYAPTVTVASPPATGLTPQDIIDIADAVWAHSSAIHCQTLLTEVWGRLGLDISAPLISGNTQISFGSIVMAMTELADNVTVTRQ